MYNSYLMTNSSRPVLPRYLNTQQSVTITVSSFFLYQVITPPYIHLHSPKIMGLLTETCQLTIKKGVLP